MIAPNDNLRGAASVAPFTLRRAPANVALYQTKHLLAMYNTTNMGADVIPLWWALVRRCKTILEVGCGNGRLCEWMVRQGKRVTGIDLVTGPYVRRGYDFTTLDLMEQELPVGFDAVVSFDVLEHLRAETIPDVLTNIGKAAPLCVLTIAGYGGPPYHLTVKSPGWWLNQLHQCMGDRQWLNQVYQRHDQRVSPVYLFMGATL